MGRVTYVHSPIPEDGYFNEVADILTSHGHPIIVLEGYALRWMGVPCLPMGVSETTYLMFFTLRHRGKEGSEGSYS